MAKHEFGGDWTMDKLERVRKYLCAHMTIFSQNPKAQYYTTIYVDAFAGTGHRVDSERPQAGAGLFETEPDPEAEAYKKGSARIALGFSRRSTGLSSSSATPTVRPSCNNWWRSSHRSGMRSRS